MGWETNVDQDMDEGAKMVVRGVGKRSIVITCKGNNGAAERMHV